ncbi:MAG: GtrA family protein [Chlorobiaceae bacterium]|nr:GtrA family protein [Chlorobiaceae bacterium]
MLKGKIAGFSAQFVLFGVAGVVGFLVDTTVLYLLKGLMGVYGARVISFLFAAFATWLFNRAITFRDQKSGHSTIREFGIYLALMTIGGSVNYGIYALLISRHEIIAQNPVIGVAAGSIAGMLINLLTSRFLLFRFRQS